MRQWAPENYRCRTAIPGGGLGLVFRAERKGDGLPVVVKTPLRLNDSDEYRFGREVRLQSQLDHPNIVPILDYDLEASPPWFSMPEAKGNLNDLLAVLAPAEAMRLFLEACAGVQHAHENKILHRDLKPQNILIFEDSGKRAAAVADFGLGRGFTRRDSPLATRSRVAAGTPGYAAPEQLIDFAKVDERADVYGLGRILQDVVNATLDPDSAHFKRLEYCFRRATAQEPEDRHQRVTDLISEVQLLLDRPAPIGRPEDRALAAVHEVLNSKTVSNIALRELSAILFENRDDVRLIHGFLPKLPPPVIKALVQHELPAFKAVLRSLEIMSAEPCALDKALHLSSFSQEIFELCREEFVKLVVFHIMVTLGSQHRMSEFEFPVVRYLQQEPELLQTAMIQWISTEGAVQKWCAEFLPRYGFAVLLTQADNG